MSSTYDNWEKFYKDLTDYWKGDQSNYRGRDIQKNILNILEKNPTKENAQEGLDGLIRSCIDGSRYSYEEINLLGTIFEKMIEMGAEINVNSFIKPEYSNRDNFEHDVYFISTKADLLKLFSNYVEIPKEIENATPIYWENMMTKDEFKLDPKYNYEEAYYNSMKYFMNKDAEYDSSNSVMIMIMIVLMMIVLIIMTTVTMINIL